MKIDHILDSFICDLADQNLDSIEEEALWEVLQQDQELFKYTIQVIRGRFLAQQLRAKMPSSDYVRTIRKRVNKESTSKKVNA